MPSTVRELMTAAGVEPHGVVGWADRGLPDVPGVYAVALTPDPDAAEPTLDTPLDDSALALLLTRRPELMMDGARPTPAALAGRLRAFWLADETVLYVGLASRSLRKRTAQMRRHRIGAASPHRGGWWLHTLTAPVLAGLYLHWATTPDYEDAEDAMLDAFAAGVSERARSELHDPERVAPWANIRLADNTDKRHGLKGITGPL